MAKHVARLDDALEAAVKAFQTTTPAVIRAELEDLRSAVQVDRIAHRKALGKIWGKIGNARDTMDDAPTPETSGNEELEAFIALQRAHGGGT